MIVWLNQNQGLVAVLLTVISGTVGFIFWLLTKKSNSPHITADGNISARGDIIVGSKISKDNNPHSPKIDLVGNIVVSSGSAGNWINFEIINVGNASAVDIKYYFSYDEPKKRSELNVACSRLSPNEKSNKIEFHYKNTEIFRREVKNLKMNFIYKDTDGKIYNSGRNIKQEKRADGNYNINGYVDDYFSLS